MDTDDFSGLEHVRCVVDTVLGGVYQRHFPTKIFITITKIKVYSYPVRLQDVPQEMGIGAEWAALANTAILPCPVGNSVAAPGSRPKSQNCIPYI